MHGTTPTLRRAAAGLVVASLLFAGCSSSDGSDGADATTTTAAPSEDTTTTTEAVDETTTTPDDGGDADGPTTEDLAAILPTAEDLGTGWGEDPSDPAEESAIETATNEQCPDAGGVLAPPDDDAATVGYLNDPDATTLRVTLSPGAEPIDTADLQAVVDSINACEPVTTNDGTFDITATFTAALNDTYGDQGLQVGVALTLTDGTSTFEVQGYRLRFRSGSVGVTITGADGLLQDGTVTPIDPAGLEATATEMDARVASL